MNDLKFYGRDNPLIETVEFVPHVVTEAVEAAGVERLVQEEAAKGGAKRLVLEGVFQRADVQNANRRVYPRKLWERILDAKSPVMKRVAERAMIGHIEHPEDGTTDLNKGAIIVTGLKLKENGEVWGQLVVLNTPAGKLLQEYVDAGVRFGISSRGTGSVDGKGVVQEDYQPETWDIVYNPSTPGAYPKMENTDTAKATNEAAGAAEILPAPSNATPAAAEPSKGGEPPKAALTLVQQFWQAGPEEVKRRTGVTDPADLAMVQWRAQKWLKQHGVYTSLDQFWTEFLKVYPLMPTVKSESVDVEAVFASGDAALEEARKKAPPKKDDKDDKKKKDTGCDDGDEDMDEAVVAEGTKLLAEANAEIARLGTEVATLNENSIKMAGDLEASTAIIAEFRKQNEALQAKCETATAARAAAEKLVADLTSVDHAAQVKEAVEDAVRKDKRLAVFREVLESQASGAAVEAKAAKLLDTLAENVKPTAKPEPAKATLESRIRARTRTTIAESKGLPTAASVSSDEDAALVTESAVTRRPAHKGAAAVKNALPRLHL